MIKLLFLLIIAFSGVLVPVDKLFAQQEKPPENVLLHPDKFYRKFMPNFKVKRNPPDSLYIKTYPNLLSVGMHILSPAIQVDIAPTRPQPVGFDPTSKFKTNIADVLGFSLNYRFVTAGFAFLMKSGMNKHDDYAPSKYRTATIKYNSGPINFQFKYLRVQGFTDVNQADPRDPTRPFTQREDMLNKEFQFEGIYNFSWKKYSYIAPLTFAQRQVKSHAGFLLKAGVYSSRFSSDSALINERQLPYYEGLADVNQIRSVSVRVAPGIGGNLVFLRRIYLSLAAFTSLDFYTYRYVTASSEAPDKQRTFAFVLEGKASLGYQSKRLYAGLRYEAERRFATLHSMEMKMMYGYTGIELGYRFDTPGFVRKFYKKTMPPGM